MATPRTLRLPLEISLASPSYGPDGQRIAFSSSRNDGRNVYVMSASGQDEKALTLARVHP
jgi:Tol biopolymer transport system component